MRMISRFAAVSLGTIGLLGMLGSPARAEDFQPDLGEVMGVVQQHHAKVYFAGQAQNWELASYELDEIKEALDDAAKAHHEFKDLKASLKDLVPAMTKLPLDKLAEAIQQKNKALFKKSFDQLTDACNRCHQTAEHPFIVIQAPSRPEYTNQKFTR